MTRTARCVEVPPPPPDGIPPRPAPKPKAAPEAAAASAPEPKPKPAAPAAPQALSEVIAAQTAESLAEWRDVPRRLQRAQSGPVEDGVGAGHWRVAELDDRQRAGHTRIGNAATHAVLRYRRHEHLAGDGAVALRRESPRSLI